VTVELKRDDIGLVISVISQELDRVGEAKEIKRTEPGAH